MFNMNLMSFGVWQAVLNGSERCEFLIVLCHEHYLYVMINKIRNGTCLYRTAEGGACVPLAMECVLSASTRD